MHAAAALPLMLGIPKGYLTMIQQARSAIDTTDLRIHTPGYRVAVTGHQHLGDAATVAFVQQSFGA